MPRRRWLENDGAKFGFAKPIAGPATGPPWAWAAGLQPCRPPAAARPNRRVRTRYARSPVRTWLAAWLHQTPQWSRRRFCPRRHRGRGLLARHSAAISARVRRFAQATARGSRGLGCADLGVMDVHFLLPCRHQPTAADGARPCTSTRVNARCSRHGLGRNQVCQLGMEALMRGHRGGTWAEGVCRSKSDKGFKEPPKRSYRGSA